MARFTAAVLVAALALFQSVVADPPPCPVNTLGQDNNNDGVNDVCLCIAGFAGTGYTLDNVQNVWTGAACTAVPCPQNSTLNPATNNTCLCDTFFANSPAQSQVTWNSNTQTWDNTCALALCPTNSARSANGVTCTCNAGYTSNPTWNAANQAFDNKCVLAACPPNSVPTVSASGIPTCTCVATYAGNPRWNATAQAFDNTCKAVPCPKYSSLSGSATCACNRFFTNSPKGSSITWNAAAQNWTNGCAAIPCPGNSTQTITTVGSATVVSCACNNFFQGTPQFVSNAWTGVCTMVSCPANAFSRTVGQCECRTGYKPNGISFSPKNGVAAAQWKGKCDFVSPGSSADFSNTTYRAWCKVFFNGAVTWVGAPTYAWINKCQLVSCPANSDRAPNGNWCNCRRGFPGPPVWDYQNLRYSKGCDAQVACSIANAAYVNGVCQCKDQYQGRIDWTGKVWQGSCSLKPCDNIRKEWRSMSAAEKNLYLRAVSSLSATPNYNNVLRSHWTMPTATDRYAHQSAGIYPWHRYYVYNYEEALRSQGFEFRCVTIPYYDWSVDGTGFINAGPFQEFGGRQSCIRTMSGVSFRYGGCISRSPSAAQGVPGSSSVYAAIRSGSITGMYGVLGSAHNAVHNDVGGTMATLNSPQDPFFFMHHGFVDYQWWLWSVCNNNWGTAGLGTVPGFGVSPAAIAAPQNSFNGRRGYRYQLSSWARSGGFLASCPNARNFLSTGSSSAATSPSSPKFNPLALATDASGAAAGEGPTLTGTQAVAMTAYWSTLQATNDEKAAQKAACTAAGTVRTYNGPSSWATTMCTQAAEYDSYLADKDVCTTFAAKYLVPSYRAKLAAEDRTCNNMMASMGGRR